MLALIFFHTKGKWHHIIILEECCQHHILQVWTWPASKDCYLYKDMMTRLLTSISFRSTLDTMAAVDFLKSLANPTCWGYMVMFQPVLT